MRKSLDVIYRPRDLLVGRLAYDGRRPLFEYDTGFIQTGLNLSPFHLKLATGIQTSDARFRGYLHGLFDDSLPDGWGLLLMDRELKKRGFNAPVTPLDRLAYIGDSAMGALSYRPCMDSEDDSVFDISEIARDSVRLFEGEISDVLPAIVRAGGSPGGAGPKVLVGISGETMVSGEKAIPDGYEHWIIKFAARKDIPRAGREEYACYLMAVDAGLNMMKSRLFEVDGNSFFSSKRFDRMDGKPVHMHTAGNLVDANFREPSLDYGLLCKLTSVLTGRYDDLLMMFRMMVFNLAIENQDDHAKNFSFLMHDDGAWRLAPAYDLTRSITAANEHATSVNGKGSDISHQDMLHMASEVGISNADANDIIDRVGSVVANMAAYMKTAGIPDSGRTGRFL